MITYKSGYNTYYHKRYNLWLYYHYEQRIDGTIEYVDSACYAYNNSPKYPKDKIALINSEIDFKADLL